MICNLGYGIKKTKIKIRKMAIGFGRVEFIKRSEGRNSCQLSAYLSRSRIFFEGNCALEPKLYDFSHRENISHHEIILPDGADENLKIAEVLWNLAEQKEVRKDAQVSMHLVLALPDDKEITLEDRIELTRTFIKKHYHGLVAECVIHPPERKIEFTEENEALGIPKGTIGTVIKEKEGNYIVSLPKGIRANPFIEIGTKYPGMSVQEHNWHAHSQLTTRRLKDNGYELEDKKATDLMPVIKKGKVVSGPDIGKLWAQHQNEFFLSKGLALRVDENGLVPQEHLGPVRMRGRAFALLEEQEKRLELNEIAASDPKNILNAITKRQSVFTKDDVERFMLKHVPGDKIQEVRKGFWKLDGLVQLRSLKTKEFVSKFTSSEVIVEEEKILRLADRIHNKKIKSVPDSIKAHHEHTLSKEQKDAYYHILDDKSLTCIQGYAGTGKSYLLKALKDAYEERGFIVRSFGPDNATASILKEKGFSSAENIYRFLFSEKYGLRKPHKGLEVWIVDEAGKLGNKPLLEFLKLAEIEGAKVILAGDSSQLPSVERGGVFKTFCERYGSEVLEDIQRQKEEDARLMAKNLAKGDIGEALDKLFNRNALSWSLTRKEAIENLVSKWAQDHQNRDSGKVLGKESSLIIAGTNDEVRVLNEMIRLVRRGRKEISEHEFACQTAHGAIYVSVGDRIEFRKNDRELGVTNGMSGVLLKAEKNCFSVGIQEHGKKTRIVSFNPEEYHRFQLGYASTCSRAQGRTVQNAYVLHSPHLNKQMAYVGLTRHVKDVHYFVSKEDALNLSDLKRKALRDGSKATTLEYTHSREVENALSSQKREETIQNLKESEHLSDRLKGKALNLWDQLNQKTYAYLEKRHDRKPDKEFFNFNEDESHRKTTVREIPKQEIKNLSIIPSEVSEKMSPQKFIETISEQDRTIKINKDRVQMKNDLYDQDPSLSDSSKRLEKRILTWKDLPKEERNLLNNYFSAASKASELREVVQAEYGESLENTSKSPHYQKWQKACALRNEAAYQLKPLLSKEENKKILKDKSVYYIETHAKKHEKILEAQKQKAIGKEKIKGIEDQLSFHVEPLLYKLFPDGPSSKTSHSFRFGAKGSLSVTIAGPKAGQFYDFERGEGGGLLKLIARELKLDKQESRAWAGEFLGIVDTFQFPTTFKKPETSIKEVSNWFSLKPDPKFPAPPLEKIGKLHHYYREVVRYPYHDLQGNLLFYVLRLENAKGEKITPPLSYGKDKNKDEASWQLKGYISPEEKRPLYNLHQLKEKPHSRVLIVEGEKAADKALEKFPDNDLVCITWSGGASSVSKTDWSPLYGREVKIWPDNDNAGFKAAEEICDVLKQIGAKKIFIPERKELFTEKLPAKWDLADPIPEVVTSSSLNRAFSFKNRNHFQESVLRELNLKKKQNAFEQIKSIDLLYSYEKTHAERLNGELSKNLTYNQIETIYLKQQHEGLKFIQKEKEIYQKVTTDPDINASGLLAQRLTHQLHLYEAKQGQPPCLKDTLILKETIECFSKKEVKCPEEIREKVLYQALRVACEKSLKGELVTHEKFEKTLHTQIALASQQKELEKSHEQALQKHQTLEQGKNYSRGPSLPF